MKGNDTLLEGRILPPLMRYILPGALSLMLQALYSLTDLWVVGNYGTEGSISAVSCGTQVMALATAVITGLATASTVCMARSLGAGEYGRVSAFVRAQAVLLGAVGAVMALALMLGADRIACAMNIPEQAYSQMTGYLRVCGAGLIFVTAYNGIAGLYRSAGNSAWPLLFVAVSGAVNLAGDIVLVAGLHLGAEGAAWATTGAQGVSVLVSVLCLARKGLPVPCGAKPEIGLLRAMRTILSIGFPVVINDIFTGISFLAVSGMVNGMGLVASTGIGIAEKLFTFFVLVPTAFLQGLAAFVAQNVGAGKPRRARGALRQALALSLCYGIAMFAVTRWCGLQIAGVFEKDPVFVKAAADYLRGGSWEYLFLAVTYCMQGYFNGCEKTRRVMFTALFSALCVRLPLTWMASQRPETDMHLLGLIVSAAAGVTAAMCLTCDVWDRAVRAEKSGAERRNARFATARNPHGTKA